MWLAGQFFLVFFPGVWYNISKDDAMSYRGGDKMKRKLMAL
jgi:hypothetical protein